jgi:hypothetical protein
MLTLSTDLGAYVRVLIQTNDVPAFPRCELRVGHYDIQLERKMETPSEAPDPWASHVIVGLRQEDSRAQGLETLVVEAIQLKDALATPVPLSATAELRWTLPPGLPRGAWLVTGRTGLLHRCRPMLLKLEEDGPQPSPSSAPDDIDDGSGHSEGLEIDPISATSLGEDFNHPDWELVEAYAAWTPDIPAAAFPVLRELANDRGAAALGLMRSDSDESFHRFWAAMDSLPYWWRSIGIRHWEDAASACHRGLEHNAKMLVDAGLQLDIDAHIAEELLGAFRRIWGRLPFLKIPLNAVGARLLQGEPLPSFARLASAERQKELFVERQRALKREDGALAYIGRLPDLDFVSESARTTEALGAWKGLWIQDGMSRVGTPRFNVVNAPVLCAAAAVANLRLRDSEVFRLRALRDLASEWFDEVHRTSFLCAVGMGAQRGA